MGKRFFGVALVATLFALSFHAQAQQATTIPRIGVLNATSAASMASRMEQFRQGLRDLGYIEGAEHCRRISLRRRQAQPVT
jgi:putative tryptophan/tyrosine transport system substrate-binding protein